MDNSNTRYSDTDREERIRERAYSLWIEQGQPEGRDLEHWMEAERNVGGEEAPQPREMDENLSVLGKEGRNE
ncbi:DUF2934 domain-containing protein [Gellertiella hungarica]|uniref:DUF2934 domain-containing protein n=1 Tax=Gellertiella hungarica TaxID=1572859 RepID=A0A7W6J4V4_9HYPH|nr:DUF2934 domain-containing protein [Gellertiella hungarica]MBB4064846.1 hypothetical protein [Gellertiella hungarica]